MAKTFQAASSQMLMLLEVIIIMQGVTSLVTEDGLCIKPEYKQAIVFLAKSYEIIYWKPKFPSDSSVGTGDVAGKAERPLMAFAML